MLRGTPEAPLPSPIRALPYRRWASRFLGGVVRLKGHLPTAVAWPVATPPLDLPAGPVEVRFAFTGRPELAVAWVEVLTPTPLRVAEPTSLDAVEGLLDRLHDLEMSAEVHTDQDLLVRTQPGLEGVIPAGGTVRVAVHTEGPPQAPILQGPLSVTVGGAGVRLGLSRARWLVALADLRIRSATLHPDGAVHLESGATGLVDRAMGRGLQHASTALSELVRRSPKFARVRSFLRPVPG